MNQSSDDFEAIIRQCLAGQQAGYAMLYESCAPTIYRLCYGVLMNRQDAEDVMQEAFVYAFKNLRRYDAARASFKTWLYTIALSRCRNLYRRGNRWNLMALLSFDLPGPASEAPESRYDYADAKAAIENALSSLSPRLREAVVLRYGHGLTFREMAEVMDCPQKTAESRVRLAHDQLRGLLRTSADNLIESLLGNEL
ncbi:MAG: RNA polymerase sigma factor [Anaerolineae bacterium]